jgi:O-acetyl-ADP-ribose deacetylase (regulator of RNase III)
MDNLDARSGGESSITPMERVGIQKRPEAFGAGVTKRAYEVLYKGFSIGVNLGDIAQVPTEAVMCPTTPWLEVGGGAIENRLADEIGDILFEGYARNLMDITGKVLTTNGDEQLRAASELQKLLEEKGGMKIEATPEQIVSDITSSCKISRFDDGKERPALFYGAAIPAPSGRLKEGGIKLVVLTNVTPDSSKSGEEGGMTRRHMEDFTYNACKTANLVGVRSITIPAIGTGFAAAYGFGLSRQDSMGGFLSGAKRFADEFGGGSALKQIDYNIYAQPNEENAKQVAKLASESGAKDLLPQN